MRITTKMTTNNLLLNLNRNSQNLNKFQMQIATGQKIQKASEDPIVAALALKFRTNVSETIQYRENAKQASSWLDVTSQAITNTNKILDRIRELAVQGASETNTIEDRQGITKEIEQLTKQLTNEANVSYAGRYVFGGFKTDQNIIFNKPVNEKYKIEQTFDLESIETIKVALPKDEETIELGEVDRIKLPYTDVDNIDFKYTDDTGTEIDLSAAMTEALSTDKDAYVVGDDEIKHIKDTGEIIFGKNVSEELKKATSINVEYDKTGFKSGDLNPQQYFNCEKYAVDTTTESGFSDTVIEKTFTKEKNDIEYEFGIDSKMKVNVQGSDVFSVSLIQDLNDLVFTINSLTPRTENQIKEDLKKTMGDDEYNKLTEKELADKVLNVQNSEEKTYRSLITSKLDKALGKLDKHKDNCNNIGAEVGSRMNRLELIESRLGDDGINYSELMTKNEGVEFEDAYINYMTQKAIYDSALSVGSKIMQKSLVDFV